MINFTVPGVPQQQGSKRHVGNGRMIETNKKLGPWRTEAISIAQAAYTGPPITEAVIVTAQFAFPRPRSHYGTGKNANKIKSSAPLWRTSAPDLDKLQRAVGDVLTQAGLILDDRLIVGWDARKHYDERPHTGVKISFG